MIQILKKMIQVLTPEFKISHLKKNQIVRVSEDKNKGIITLLSVDGRTAAITSDCRDLYLKDFAYGLN